jgi:hypothetical protein
MLVDEAVIRTFEQWATDGMTSDPFQVARLILREKIIGLQIQISRYDFQVMKRKPWNIDTAAASRPAANEGEQDITVLTFYL